MDTGELPLMGLIKWIRGTQHNFEPKKQESKKLLIFIIYECFFLNIAMVYLIPSPALAVKITQYE